MFKGVYLRAIVYIFFIGVLFGNHANNKFFIEISGTNLISAVSSTSPYNQSIWSDAMPAISLGYNRANSVKINSGIGVQFIPGLDRTEILSTNDVDQDDQSFIDSKNLYGLSLIYYLSRKVGNFDMGIHSYYHLGFTLSDFIVGVKIGYRKRFKDIWLGINCFYGYADMINFLDNFSMSSDAIDMNKFIYNFGLTLYVPMGDVSS